MIVGDGALALGIGPRAFPGQLAVFGPESERKRKCPDLVTRHRRINRQLQTRELLLHESVWVLRELRVPERVVAKLEALIGQEFYFAMPPFGLLPFDVLVAKERTAGFGAREHAEYGLVFPAR